jgi:putative nucleotidyltransferase with HDIG domain
MAINQQATPPAPRPDRATEEERESQRAGRDFLYALHTALRAVKLYPIENQTVQKALTELDLAAGAIIGQEEGISIRYVGDFCFINDLRLRVDLTSYATFGVVGRALRAHEVGQIETSSKISRGDWTTLLSLLVRDPDGEDPFGRLSELLERSPAREIHLAPLVGADETSDRDPSRDEAKRTYAHTVAVAREALLGARIGRVVSVRRVKRAVQHVVDQVLTNESAMVGMTVLRDYDQYTFAHSVNVAIFSIALGKKLGLSKIELCDLGMGALLHDIGKSRTPIELVTKAGQLEEPEWEILREHPTEGLLALLEMRGAGEVPFRAMLIAYEHHMKVDQTGYPQSKREREPTLYSRIVAIADGFDAATTRRSYQATPWLPDAVLREMRDNPDRGFDPLLVKAFISMTGIYPVGSVVVLDTFELAVVVSTNQETPSRPQVKVIFDELGIPVSPPRMLDLSQVDPGTGAPLRTVVKATDPERYGINIKDYFA